MESSIYFLAIVPPEEIQKEVTEFKNYTVQNFNSKKALNSPPHITIVPPFKYEEEKISNVIQEVNEFSKGQKHFEIELKNFNCFAPRVIYVDVLKNTLLSEMRQDINHLLEQKCNIEFKYKEQDFHPHMTIAFKDLKANVFPKAWDHFRRKKYNAIFNAEAIYIFKHNGTKWEIMNSFEFEK